MAKKMILKSVVTSNAITLTITANRVSGTSPMGVVFNASIETEIPGVDIPDLDGECYWVFDDPNSSADYMGDEWWWGTSRNIATGHTTSHTFNGADKGYTNGVATFVVSCTACIPGHTPVTATITITCYDTEDVFNDIDNCVYLTDSLLDANGPDGVSMITSMGSINSNLTGSNGNFRIYVKNGVDFTSLGALIWNKTGTKHKLIIQGWNAGSTVKPLLQRINSQADVDQEFIVTGVKMKGDYDPTLAPYPASGYTLYSGQINLDHKSYDLIYAHKTFFNFETEDSTLPLAISDRQVNWVAENFKLHGWQNFGIFSGEAGAVGISHGAILQKTGTVAGNDQNKDGNGVDDEWYPFHGAIRLSRISDVVVPLQKNLAMHHLYMRNMNDWGSNNTSRTYQPNIRVLAGLGDDVDARVCVSCFISEGGSVYIHNKTTNFSSVDIYGLIENGLIIDNAHVLGLGIGHGGTYIRNVQVNAPQIPAGSSSGTQSMMSFNDELKARGSAPRKIKLIHVTFANLQNDAQARSRADYEAGTGTPRDYLRTTGWDSLDVEFIGILDWCPNRTVATGETTAAPLTAIEALTPGIDGERFEHNPLDTSRAATMADYALLKPGTGSSAINAVSNTRCRDFYLNEINSSSDTLGAIHHLSVHPV